MNFDIQDFIRTRRNNNVHSQDSLMQFCQLSGSGKLPDYQIAAWLMAAYLNPLNSQETVDLTVAMANSGKKVDLHGIPKPWVDKHSTGGVGDKTSIVLVPLLAACGLSVVKMSGRGLGITGGTLDKLASIPGFRTDLTIAEMISQTLEIGMVLTGQSPEITPADKVFYSLRDATATVDSMPLMVSSILSKKIASGAEYVALDIKCGSGGFMKSPEIAFRLEKELKRVGSACGLKISTHVTDMSQPLGEAVGNALEIEEAFNILKNENSTSPSRRFRSLCIELAAETLVFCGQSLTRTDALQEVSRVLQSGSAWNKAKQWLKAQGAISLSAEKEPLIKTEVYASESGYLAQIDAGMVGMAVLALGGGRHQKDDQIDLQVGVKIHKIIGDQVNKGESIVTIFSQTEATGKEALEQIIEGIKIEYDPVLPTPIFLREPE